jgi:hypothetical protein
MNFKTIINAESENACCIPLPQPVYINVLATYLTNIGVDFIGHHELFCSDAVWSIFEITVGEVVVALEK